MLFKSMTETSPKTRKRLSHEYDKVDNVQREHYRECAVYHIAEGYVSGECL